MLIAADQYASATLLYQLLRGIGILGMALLLLFRILVTHIQQQALSQQHWLPATIMDVIPFQARLTLFISVDQFLHHALRKPMDIAAAWVFTILPLIV